MSKKAKLGKSSGLLITAIESHGGVGGSNEEKAPQSSPTRPLSSKHSRKSVRINSPQELLETSNTSNHDTNISTVAPSNPMGTIKQGKDARLLVPKAQDLRNRIVDGDSHSRRLLRDIYTAESSFGQASTKERIIGFYLRTKFDSGVLQDFAKQVLAGTFDSVLKCEGEFDTSIEIENILKEDLITQIDYITQIADNFRSLVIDICTRLLDICGLPAAEDVTFPSLCSPKLNMMMSCFRSYLSMHQAIQSIELSAAERQTDNLVETLKQQKAFAEQDLAAVQSEFKALKARHDSLFSDSGGKNQTVVRQQVIIDTLELQIRSFHKQLEDIQMERKKFAQTEAILNGELLSVTTQFNSLRALYESEICTLRPLFQEQVMQISEDRKEMTSLRTDVELSAKRFSQTEEKLFQFQQEIHDLRKEKSDLERKVSQLEQKLLESSQEIRKQKKLVEITLAAKLSSDSLLKEAEKKTTALEQTIHEMSELKSQKELDIDRFHEEREEMKKEIEEMREEISRLSENRSGDRAEWAAQEMVVSELKMELQKIKETGYTDEKRLEWEEKERLVKDVSEQLRKHKNQLKLALTRIHEMQEEIDGLRMRLGTG